LRAEARHSVEASLALGASPVAWVICNAPTTIPLPTHGYTRRNIPRVSPSYPTHQSRQAISRKRNANRGNPCFLEPGRVVCLTENGADESEGAFGSSPCRLSLLFCFYFTSNVTAIASFGEPCPRVFLFSVDLVTAGRMSRTVIVRHCRQIAGQRTIENRG